MSDWEISLLMGIVLTFVLIGLLALLGRLEEKRIQDQRAEERRNRRSFEWGDSE